MSEAEIRKNPCGNDKEIDEYLNGTICEIVTPEEDLNDIEAPEDDCFEVLTNDDRKKLKTNILENQAKFFFKHRKGPIWNKI